jgi:hypothetical protein
MAYLMSICIYKTLAIYRASVGLGGAMKFILVSAIYLSFINNTKNKFLFRLTMN